MEVSTELDDDMVTIMLGADKSKKFFWKEQQKYVKSSSTRIRYYPMTIIYCLSLATKSSAANGEIGFDEKKVLVS